MRACLASLVGLVDDGPRPLRVVGEPGLGPAEVHGQGHQPLLGAVVQVPLDTAALGVRGADRLGPAAFELADPAGHVRLAAGADQVAGDRDVGGGQSPRHRRRHGEQDEPGRHRHRHQPAGAGKPASRCQFSRISSQPNSGSPSMATANDQTAITMSASARLSGRRISAYGGVAPCLTRRQQPPHPSQRRAPGLRSAGGAGIRSRPG